MNLTKTTSIIDSVVLICFFGVVSSTISAPHRLKVLYTQSLIFRFIYVYIGVHYSGNLGCIQTFLGTLILLMFYDTMIGDYTDEFKPFFSTLYKLHLHIRHV